MLHELKKYWKNIFWVLVKINSREYRTVSKTTSHNESFNQMTDWYDSTQPLVHETDVKDFPEVLKYLFRNF